MAARFPWKRFWSPREGRVVVEEPGYLWDPEPPERSFLNPDVTDMAQLSDARCLILLGEPGIGKSEAVRDEVRRLHDIAEGPSVGLIDAKDYASEDRLWLQVFESAEWRAWQTEPQGHGLFIDALDEGLLRIATFSRLVLRALRELRAEPLQRLRLRVACRTAEWPATLEAGLRDIFGTDNVHVVELAPLRRADVERAAAESGFDPDEFLDAVERRQVGSLAAKPLTLNFLLAAFRAHGSTLPQTRERLYEQGCLHLCQEPDVERREQASRESRRLLTPPERLATATRIAAITMLGNRAAVWVGDALGEIPESDVPAGALAGGTVQELAIRDTLKTGLFTSRGADRLGWAHQSLAEYLAARSLQSSPLVQVKSLLGQADGRKQWLVPQLHETAAWLAGMRVDVFDWLLSVEPEVSLTSDVLPDAGRRQKLVAALLEGFAAGSFPDDPRFYRSYHKLAHPRLAAQIEPVIVDRQAPVVARRAAVDIAEACELRELVPRLLEIALDATEPHDVRTQAAHAIWRIGDEINRLAPLARGEAGDDPDDDLRGIALRALWPRFLTAQELVPCLLSPKRENYFGHYWHSLNERMVQAASDRDLGVFLAAAADWAVTGEQGESSSFGDVQASLVRRALVTLSTPGVIPALARLVVRNIRGHHRAWPSDGKDEVRDAALQNDARRRAVLQAVLNETDLRPYDCVGVWMSPGLMQDVDAEWLLDGIVKAPHDRQPAWARCIHMLTRNGWRAAVTDGILELRGQVPALADEFEWLAAWELDGERARQTKQAYYEGLDRQRRRDRPPLESDPRARLVRHLEQFELGNAAGWVRTVQDLSLTPTSRSHNWDFASDIEKTPGWRSADDELRQRIKSAARQFIVAHAPAKSAWIATNSVPETATAGYQAMRLLMNDHEFISSVSDATWRLWAPTFVAHPGVGNTWHKALVCLAYRNAPEVTLDCLSVLLDMEDEVRRGVYYLEDLADCWDDRLDSFVIERIRRGGLKPDNLIALAQLLLARGTPEVFPALADGATDRATGDDARARILALLLAHADDERWTELWPIGTAEPEILERALGQVERHPGRPMAFNRLSEDRLGELYLWMSRKYPPASDPGPEPDGHTGRREHLGRLRSQVLRWLVNRGTMDAVKVIAQLVAALPDQHPWLAWRLREAESNARRAEWKPASAADIRALLEASAARYVQSEEQLAALLESLDRLQGHLQGHLPSVTALWNYNGTGNRRTNFRPKDEEDLSDNVARWLEDDRGPSRGIVVNREVQPRRGSKTDIWVDAIETQTNTRLTIVIEVKGCWNRQLWTAAELQLVQQYLAPNRLHRGIYLIGWFACETWSSADKRKRATPKLALSEVRARLIAELGALGQTYVGVVVTPCVLDLGLPVP
jgi:hypothetical protein